MQTMNNIFQMFGAIKNPQQFIQHISGNSQIMNNPMVKNAMTMYQNSDNDGLKKMTENICHEKGINPEDALKQIKSQSGM